MKRAELLKTNHEVQLNWLKNQIMNITQDAKSFRSTDHGVIERAYERLDRDLIVKEAALENFIAEYLSNTGMKRLVTTLRMHLKRSGEYKLQVQLDKETTARLHALVKNSGKTQVELVQNLINQAYEGAEDE